MRNLFVSGLVRLILLGLFVPSSLLVALAQDNVNSPVLFMQTGHSGVIRSIDISADGKLAVTGADDSSIRIWSVATGF
jgi:WD40 repeat protein